MFLYVAFLFQGKSSRNDLVEYLHLCPSHSVPPSLHTSDGQKGGIKLRGSFDVTKLEEKRAFVISMNLWLPTLF